MSGPGQAVTSGDISHLLVAGRSCGTCALCCKLYPVDPLNKPRGVWCKHCSPGRGCQIHAERPPVCREFFCNWLLVPHLGPEWKPEKCKFVLHSITYANGDQCLDITVDPDYPHNWRKPEFYEQIKSWARQAAQQASGPIYFVLVQTGKRKIVMLPDREIDLGQLSDTDQFEVTRDVKAGVASFAVKVVPRANS